MPTDKIRVSIIDLITAPDKKASDLKTTEDSFLHRHAITLDVWIVRKPANNSVKTTIREIGHDLTENTPTERLNIKSLRVNSCVPIRIYLVKPCGSNKDTIHVLILLIWGKHDSP